MPGMVTSLAWSDAQVASRRRWRGIRGCLGMGLATPGRGVARPPRYPPPSLSVDPNLTVPAGGRSRVIDAEGETVPEGLVAADSDATLTEYAAAFTARAGRAVPGPMVRKALERLGLARKKSPCGPASGTARTWWRSVPPTARTPARSIPPG